jgi:hypothetical protein
MLQSISIQLKTLIVITVYVIFQLILSMLQGLAFLLPTTQKACLVFQFVFITEYVPD